MRTPKIKFLVEVKLILKNKIDTFLRLLKINYFQLIYLHILVYENKLLCG